MSMIDRYLSKSAKSETTIHALDTAYRRALHIVEERDRRFHEAMESGKPMEWTPPTPEEQQANEVIHKYEERHGRPGMATWDKDSMGVPKL